MAMFLFINKRGNVEEVLNCHILRGGVKLLKLFILVAMQVGSHFFLSFLFLYYILTFFFFSIFLFCPFLSVLYFFSLYYFLFM